MELAEIRPGILVRSRRASPVFREGALFQVVSMWNELTENSVVACRAVGMAPFKVWYFRIFELDLAGIFRPQDESVDR